MMNLNSLVNLADIDFACYCASKKCAIVRWKIKKSKIEHRSKKTELFVSSPEFKFLKSSWVIWIKLCDSNEGKESLFLYVTSPVTERDKKFTILFAIKNNQGEVLKSFAVENETLQSGKDYGLTHYYHLQDYSDRRLVKVLLNNSFIVHCNICVLDRELKVNSNTADADALNKDFGFLLEREKYSDVVLKVEDEALPAHKLILSTRSEVFRAMFDSDMKENNLSSVELVEMSPDVAKIMLRYIYTEKLVEINEENMLDLYAAAEKYFLLSMKTMCLNFILKNLTVDNVCDVALFADLHSDDLLKEATEEFLSWNVKSVVETKAWNTLSETNSQFFLSFIKRAILINPFVL